MVVPEDAPSGSSGFDWKYQRNWRQDHPDATSEQEVAALQDHYWETRAKDEDLLADVYCHLLRKRLVDYVTGDPANRSLPALHFYFNRELVAEGDRHAFQIFAKRLGFNPANTLSYKYYPTAAAGIKTKIHSFSELWYYNRFHKLIFLDSGRLDEFADRLTARFVIWLQEHRGT
jgi:hypothetical protein